MRHSKLMVLGSFLTMLLGSGKMSLNGQNPNSQAKGRS